MTELEALTIVENIVKLTKEGYAVTIWKEFVTDMATGEDIEPYCVQVCDKYDEVSSGESEILSEAMTEAYGSTPEKEKTT